MKVSVKTNGFQYYIPSIFLHDIEVWTHKKNLNPAAIYMFKVINRNTPARCEICSELIIKTPIRRLWRRFSVVIVNFEYISHLVLVFQLLTLSR